MRLNARLEGYWIIQINYGKELLEKHFQLCYVCKIFTYKIEKCLWFLFPLSATYKSKVQILGLVFKKRIFFFIATTGIQSRFKFYIELLNISDINFFNFKRVEFIRESNVKMQFLDNYLAKININLILTLFSLIFFGKTKTRQVLNTCFYNNKKEAIDLLLSRNFGNTL